jgi:hypothetical protein
LLAHQSSLNLVVTGRAGPRAGRSGAKPSGSVKKGIVSLYARRPENSTEPPQQAGKTRDVMACHHMRDRAYLLPAR